MFSNTNNWLGSNLESEGQMMLKQGVAICLTFFCLCISAVALDVGIYFDDLADVKMLKAASGGRTFNLVMNRYWRENFNAHSYSLIIISFAGKRGREIVPIENEDKKGYRDFIVDVPADFECFKKKAIVAG